MIRKHFIFSAAALLSGLLLLPAQAANLPESGICAHRGNNAHFPENTLPAFKSAIELGAAQIELDVCCSKDQKLVIMHDLNVRRTTSGEGDIRQKTLEEIKALDIVFKGKPVEGVKVPTFQEVLDITPRNIWINIHLKENRLDLLLEIGRILEKEGRLEQAFCLCGREIAVEARKVIPGLKICNPPSEKTFADYVDSTIQYGFEFVQPNRKYPVLDAENVKRLHDAGVKINYFGVKNGDHCRELIEKVGVDFPLCDDVTECASAMKEKP